MPRAELEAALDDRIARGIGIAQRPIPSPEDLEAARADYYTWSEYNQKLLEHALTTPAEALSYSGFGGAVGYAKTFPQHIADLRDSVRRKVRKLASLKEQLPLYETSDEAPSGASSPTTAGGDVFIVHGHDGAAREATARFVQRVLGVEPVILGEQPNRGQTVIEKFERHGGTAGFAIVLLTADDLGRALAGLHLEHPRGRQNVVFEFGYFVGRLGRSQTAVLYAPEVELPSDLGGLVYIELDTGGGWKSKLAKELGAAGFEVDFSKV